MFQFPPFPPHTYVFSMRYPGIPPGGFPHSDISGSMLVGSSPKLFAACYVLRRPLAPRHPPYALSSLITCKREDLHSVQFLRCQYHLPAVALLSPGLPPCERPQSLARGLPPLALILPGGDEGTRTPGLLRAREALSHLSYIPLRNNGPFWTRTRDLALIRGTL